MSTTVEQAEAPSTHRPSKADSLAASVVILLVMTVAQRAIGFGRGIFFCRWLDPEQLGQWDLAFGFLNLAAPLAVLGLPGSFGRYVEYFRQRGQFHLFVRRMAIACGLLGAVATSGVVVCRDWFSKLIFGEPDQGMLVVLLAGCLAMVIGHNYLVSLFIAVRKYRFVTVLQFVQSCGFAVISLALMASISAGAGSAVVAYAVATLLSAAGALAWLRLIAADEPADRPANGQAPFWTRLAPFALWMWVTNVMANLFDLIDRYMIVHHSGMSAHEALEVVGYYHSSRIVPLLFVSIAALLGSVITPHLSADWEMGRRESVVLRLNRMLKFLLFGLLAVSVGVLFVAPWLFGVAFAHKFSGGLHVLPLTLAYCAWFGTLSVAQNYLWCTERAALGSVGILAGLLINIGLNLVLLPRYGLEGAVVATTVANLVALSAIYLLSQWHGMHVHAGTWILTLAPLTLAGGAWVGLATVAALAVVSLLTDWIFSAADKHEVAIAVRHGWELAARKLGRGAATGNMNALT